MSKTILSKGRSAGEVSGGTEGKADPRNASGAVVEKLQNMGK